jgi:hypothetical protein
MAACELPLVALLSVILARLALLGRSRGPPSWTALFAPGAVAWMAGAQGLLFRRHPDYMVAYLFEAREAAWLAYSVWCVAALSLAWAFSTWTLRVGQSAGWDLLLLVVVASLVGLLAIPLAGRLGLIGSTFEFRQGVARPLAFEPAARILLDLTAIGSFIPVAGAGLLVAADGLRAGWRERRG